MESMERNDQDARVESRDEADQTDPADAGSEVDLPSTTIIGTNIAGANTAPYPGGIVAPAAELSGEEAEAEAEGVGTLNLDALDHFGAERSGSGDEGVSANQSETEAGEMNG